MKCPAITKVLRFGRRDAARTGLDGFYAATMIGE
jgi:hypothetical protein